METKTQVFINVVAVTSRTAGRPLRWKSRLIARGTGTELYTSRPSDTHDGAEMLARRFLATPRGSRLTLDRAVSL